MNHVSKPQVHKKSIHVSDYSGWIDQRGRITDGDKMSSVMLASNSG